MPVSRKRKKAKQKTSLRRRQDQGSTGRSSPPGGGSDDATDFLADLARHRRELDLRRTALARTAAGPLVVDLTRLAGTATDGELEDALCTRLGRTLTELDDQADNGDFGGHVSPNTLLEVLVETALEALEEAISNDEGWQAPWRVSCVVAGVVPRPFAALVAEAVDDLRGRINSVAPPHGPAGPTLTGRPLWTRDHYGTRTGVVAPLRVGDGQQRWYLWDIDACAGTARTVHSRYHATLDEALADWQTGVGEPAATGTTFGPIDDRQLLDRLMPREEGIMRIGGENTGQFAEYHRSKRLAEVVLDEFPLRSADVRDDERSPKDAARRFCEWYRQQRDSTPEPPDFGDLVAELADSWQILGTDGPYRACSPHRIMQVMAHVRSFYQDDFATTMTALLPAWVSWLVEETGLPTHLAERSRAAALHPAPDNDEPNLLARITE